MGVRREGNSRLFAYWVEYGVGVGVGCHVDAWLQHFQWIKQRIGVCILEAFN